MTQLYVYYAPYKLKEYLMWYRIGEGACLVNNKVIEKKNGPSTYQILIPWLSSNFVYLKKVTSRKLK